MRRDDLPGPGNFSGSQKLLTETVKAISFTEIADSYRPPNTGPCDQAVRLLAFFEAAAEKVRPLAEKVATKPTKTKEKKDEI